MTCNPAEIDAERGVILEEKRQRSDASWRMFEKSLPYYYGDTPMARRTLIGGEEQLKTFKYESLTNFYKTWCIFLLMLIYTRFRRLETAKRRN